MPWQPSTDFEQTLGHALDLSIGKWRDDLTRATYALRPDHSRRGILGSGAAAKHAWSAVWSPALGALPMRFVAVAMELFDAHRARLTKDAAGWLSSMIETRFEHLTIGLTREADELFAPAGFRHLLPDLMRRLAIQARAEINRRYDLARFAGEGRVDQLVTDALSKAALEEDLAERVASNEPFAAIFCDLDRFKSLNDTFGHAAGDQALKAFGRVLRGILGDRGRVYRNGGDEFVVLVNDVGDEAMNVVDAIRAIEPDALTSHPADVGVSAGMALFPADGASADDLLTAADAAMYRNKGDRKRE